MSRGRLQALGLFCLVLGVADLAVLNSWLLPAAWPELGDVQAAPTSAPKSSGDERGPPATSAAVTAPERTAQPHAPSATPAPSEPAPVAAKPTAEEPTAQPPAPESSATAAPPEPSPPPAEPAPQPVAGEVPFRYVMFTYSSGQCLCTSAMQDVLAPRIAWLKRHPELKVSIGGHTDPTGDPQGHGHLSILRARNVADYFEQSGIDASRIKVLGHGQSMPADTSGTPAAQTRNRRVVVRVLGGAP